MRKLLWRSTRALPLLSLTLFVASCSTVSAGTECAWVKVITISRQDVLTDETARQLLAHNEKVEAICGR